MDTEVEANSDRVDDLDLFFWVVAKTRQDQERTKFKPTEANER